MYEEDLPPAPLGHRLELALQLVAMIERLGERVAHTLAPTAASKPVPLPVAALDPATLDLERDDPLLRVREHEVALVVLRAGGMVAKDDARGVEDLPLVREAVAQCGEHLPLPRALELLLEQRTRVHASHGRQVVRSGDEPRNVATGLHLPA